nr:immunoglobulin light chain junction region [Macaca mulatta]MPO05539.1 immunoglobulin light chain junction region [Macaca mulatta]MPO05785.1 immunoglobulin light chain junction region [Macaca mulatta]MPO11774.1 immunoglobulin light chain junction region [Macaca mulatta]
YSSYAGSNVLF